MTSSGCSMEGALPKEETVPTVLGVAQFWNESIFQGLGMSNRMKPADSEFALRAFPGCLRICSGCHSRNAQPCSGHLQIVRYPKNTRIRCHPPSLLQSPFAVIGPSWGRRREYSSDTLQDPEKDRAIGIVLHLSHDRVSNLAWAAKTKL